MKKTITALVLCAAVAAAAGEPAKYSENSILVKKPDTPVKSDVACVKEDAAAGGGTAAWQRGKEAGWSVQWPVESFAKKLAAGKEYVFKMRVRPEFASPPAADGSLLIVGLYNLKTGRGAFKIPFAAYDEGKYRDVFLFRAKADAPQDLKGYFYCTPDALPFDFSVWYDHIEFIPVEEFKDAALAEKLPLFPLE